MKTKCLILFLFQRQTYPTEGKYQRDQTAKEKVNKTSNQHKTEVKCKLND